MTIEANKGFSLESHDRNYKISFREGLKFLTTTGWTYAERHFYLAEKYPAHSCAHTFIGIVQCIPVIGGVAALSERIASAIISICRRSFSYVDQGSSHSESSISPRSVTRSSQSEINNFSVNMFSQHNNEEIFAGDEEPPSPRIAKQINFSTLKPKIGNEWLQEASQRDQEALKKYPNVFHCLRIVIAKWKDKCEWNYPSVFPNRTVQREEISKVSIEEIKLLSLEDLLAIIDLLDFEQASNFFNDSSISDEKRHALLLFNDAFGEKIANTIQKELNAPIDSETIEKANILFKSLPKYNVRPVKQIDPEKADALNEESSCISRTVGSANFEDPKVVSWKSENDGQLPQEVTKMEISQGRLSEINSFICNEFCFDACMMSDEELYPYRPFTHLALEESTNQFYIPPKQVKNLVATTLEWMNNELKKCDAGEANPIIIAALVYQKLVTIHAFPDGNLRTARHVADMILRKYGLLPVAWDKEEVKACIFFQATDERETPTRVVEKMIRALERSNEIVKESHTTEL